MLIPFRTAPQFPSRLVNDVRGRSRYVRLRRERVPPISKSVCSVEGVLYQLAKSFDAPAAHMVDALVRWPCRLSLGEGILTMWTAGGGKNGFVGVPAQAANSLTNARRST